MNQPNQQTNLTNEPISQWINQTNSTLTTDACLLFYVYIFNFNAKLNLFIAQSLDQDKRNTSTNVGLVQTSDIANYGPVQTSD